MSIECRECERDLRGGHDPSCSRHRYCQCGHSQLDHYDSDVGCNVPGCACVGYRAKEVRDG